MSGSFLVSKLRFNLKQCAVKMWVSTFASLAVSSVHSSFAWIVIVMRFCDELEVVRTYWKMPYSACLLSRKVAIETVKNFASADMVTLSYISSNSQFFHKPVASMWLVVWNRENYTMYFISVDWPFKLIFLREWIKLHPIKIDAAPDNFPKFEIGPLPPVKKVAHACHKGPWTFACATSVLHLPSPRPTFLMVCSF